MSNALTVLVNELRTLYTVGAALDLGGERGIVRVYAAMILMTGDWPGLADCTGSADHGSILGCGLCWARTRKGLDANGRQAYIDLFLKCQRTRDEHWNAHLNWLAAPNTNQRNNMYTITGLRATSLMTLPYLAPSEVQAADLMHAIFMGVCADLMKQVTGQHVDDAGAQITDPFIHEDLFEYLEKRVRLLNPAREVTSRPVTRISGSFTGMTADQWRAMFSWFLPTLLCGVFAVVKVKGARSRRDTFVPNPLAPALVTLFLLLGRIVQLLCVRIVHIKTVEYADKLMYRYVLLYRAVFGPGAVKPNHHRMLHTLQMFRRFGSVYAWWCMGYEEYNGELGSTPSNRREAEFTFAKRLFEEQYLTDLTSMTVANWLDSNGATVAKSRNVQSIFDTQLGPRERALLRSLELDQQPKTAWHDPVNATVDPAQPRPAFTAHVTADGHNPLEYDTPETMFRQLWVDVQQETAAHAEACLAFDVRRQECEAAAARVQETRAVLNRARASRVPAAVAAAEEAHAATQRRHDALLNLIAIGPPPAPTAFALRVAEAFHPTRSLAMPPDALVQAGPPVVHVLHEALAAFRFHGATTSVNLSTMARLTTPLRPGASATAGQLRDWLRQLFSAPPVDVVLHSPAPAAHGQPRPSIHCSFVSPVVEIHHTVSFMGECFNSQSSNKDRRAYILVCRQALTDRMRREPDFAIAFPRLERHAFAARIECFVTVPYHVEDTANRVTSRHTVTFAVCRFYRLHPRRASWEWGVLAELYHDTFLPFQEMGPLALVPLAHITGKFLPGPAPSAPRPADIDPSLANTITVSRLPPRVVM